MGQVASCSCLPCCSLANKTKVRPIDNNQADEDNVFNQMA